jgi:hypothetical protein
MTIDRLLELEDITTALPYESRRFAFRDGLRILFDICEDSDDWSARSDHIYYGDIEKVAQKITEEQAIKLFQLGWFIDEDSFCLYS